MLDLNMANNGDVVTLTEAIVNPKPDRRTRHDWRLADTIPAGTKFTVRLTLLDDDYLDGDAAEKYKAKLAAEGCRMVGGEYVLGYELTPLRGFADGVRFTRTGAPREGFYPALGRDLLDALVPLTEFALGDLLLQHSLAGGGAQLLLAVLLDHGKLDLADIRLAITAFEALNTDAAKLSRFSARHAV